MSSILFSKDSSGTWWITSHAQQCQQDYLFKGKCQGAEGHTGDCWCYSENGALELGRNTTDIAIEFILPGNSHYIQPEVLHQYCYRSLHQTDKVTDDVTICLLEEYDHRTLCRIFGRSVEILMPLPRDDDLLVDRSKQ